MPVERELKYGIDREAAETLLRRRRLGPFSLGPAVVVNVTDRYFDTPDMRLLSRRYACRLRIQDGRAMATLKGMGGVTDGLHEREEIEIALAEPLDPARWPDPLRTQIVRLADGEPIRSLFDLAQIRRQRSVRMAGVTVAVMTVDDVTVRAAHHTWRWQELEVELAPDGTLQDLHALRALLQDVPGLRAAEESKFERVLRWLGREDDDGPEISRDPGR